MQKVGSFILAMLMGLAAIVAQPGLAAAHPQMVATIAVGLGNNPSAVATNPTTNQIYVANEGSNNVSVFDGATNRFTAGIGVGQSPSGVGVNLTTNRIYVTNANSNTVSVIAGATNTVSTTIGVGNQPLTVGINLRTNRIYVTNVYDDTVSVIEEN